jgi:hypothetical protein
MHATPSILANVYARPQLLTSNRETSARAKKTKCVSVSRKDSLGAARGFLAAVCLESVMAIGVYSLWQVWHLVR